MGRLGPSERAVGFFGLWHTTTEPRKSPPSAASRLLATARSALGSSPPQPYTRRSDWIAWLVFSLLYLAATGHLAARRVLWSDEITSVLIAHARDWHTLWESSLRGPDTLPPLGVVLMRLCRLPPP